MVYDVYFHDDFDGRASAAVMLAFFRSRGDRVAGFYAVDYGMKNEFFAPGFLSKPNSLGGGRNPSVLLDFAYHPAAAWWFDHHGTAFRHEEWRRKFKSDLQHRWDVHYQSCAHLVLDSLVRDFGFSPPRHFRELAKWLDVIDGANFTSAKQAISLTAPALQLNEFIERAKGDRATDAWLIGLLAAKPLREIVREPRIAKIVRRARASRRKLLAFYRTYLGRHRAITFIDLARHEAEDLRFAPYYLYPKTRYHLSLKKYSRGPLHVSLAANFMRRGENKTHLGEFLKKRYGGGGHHDAAGAEFGSRAEAEKAVREIVERFRD